MSQSAFLVAVVSLQNLGFNLVHPVTPAFIAATGMQDWIFGVSYAAMALTSFLFSKGAGELCMRFESRYVFAVGCMGYAAAQLMFLASTSEAQVIAWRLFSGFFVAMINVSSLVYLVRMSAGDKRARSLIHLATATAVTTALGYTVGGIVGNESYARAFLAQFAALAVAGLLLALLGGRLRDGARGYTEAFARRQSAALGFGGFPGAAAHCRVSRRGADFHERADCLRAIA